MARISPGTHTELRNQTTDLSERAQNILLYKERGSVLTQNDTALFHLYTALKKLLLVYHASFSSVSYTHLDVYKRQVDACAEPAEYKESPFYFEAGTPNISGVIGLGAAITFLEHIGFETIRTHEKNLLTMTLTRLRENFGDQIHILGTDDIEKRGGLISFTLDHIHPHDLAQILGEHDISIRAGEHCAALLHRKLGLSATARVSFGIYNTEEDVEKLISGIKNARTLFDTKTPLHSSI